LANATAAANGTNFTWAATHPGAALALEVTADADVGAATAAAAAVAITVPVTKTFKVLSTYTLSIAGTLDVAGDVEVAGALTLDGTTGTNTGTITVKSGGATTSLGAVDLTGAGLTVVEIGGQASREVAANTTVLFIGDDDDADAVFQLTAASTKLSFNNDGYELDGTGTFNGLQGGYDGTVTYTGYWIGADLTLTLTANSTLTVAAGSILGLGFEASGTVTPRALGAAGASIVATGTIECEGARPQNFYPNGNTTAIAYPGSGTFNWNTDAGGSGVAGWKKSS
jgi:hypothetical protein